MRIRLIFWVLLAAVVIGAATVVAVGYVRHRGEERRARLDEAERGRATRSQQVAAIALAPLPLASPLVERQGKDAYGYPRSYVDEAAVRSLLGRGKYVELTQYTEELQRAFDADFHTEYYLRGVVDAFYSAEPALEPALDAWVQATPASFAPYLARASHHVSAGFAARGSGWARETDSSNFDEMRRQFALGRADVDRALERTPRSLAALRLAMIMSYTGSEHRDFDALTHRAFELCAACMQPRVIVQAALEPRWGGNYRQMKAAADAAPVSDNPLLRLLPGYAEADRAEGFVRDKQLERALEHIERACALGDLADFLETKADVLRRLDKVPEAIAALRRALDLKPSNAGLLFALARAETHVKDWRGAYRDLSAGLRIDPTSSEGRSLKETIVKGLVYIGWEAHKQGKDGEALDALDEAAELDPSRDVEGRRGAVLTSGFHGTDAEIATLERGVLDAPHDFSVHVRLDYALSTRRDWPRIMAMWTRYLNDNPTDARAYRERAGTFAQLHRMLEARADAERACQLGSSAGCALMRR